MPQEQISQQSLLTAEDLLQMFLQKKAQEEAQARALQPQGLIPQHLIAGVPPSAQQSAILPPQPLPGGGGLSLAAPGAQLTQPGSLLPPTGLLANPQVEKPFIEQSLSPLARGTLPDQVPGQRPTDFEALGLPGMRANLNVERPFAAPEGIPSIGQGLVPQAPGPPDPRLQAAFLSGEGGPATSPQAPVPGLNVPGVGVINPPGQQGSTPVDEFLTLGQTNVISDARREELENIRQLLLKVPLHTMPLAMQAKIRSLMGPVGDPLAGAVEPAGAIIPGAQQLQAEASGAIDTGQFSGLGPAGQAVTPTQGVPALAPPPTPVPAVQAAPAVAPTVQPAPVQPATTADPLSQFDTLFPPDAFVQPDYSKAQGLLSGLQGTPEKEISERDRVSRVLGGGAQGAIGARTVSETLLGFGAGASRANTEVSKENRKIRRGNEARNKEFIQSSIRYEMAVATAEANTTNKNVERADQLGRQQVSLELAELARDRGEFHNLGNGKWAWVGKKADGTFGITAHGTIGDKDSNLSVLKKMLEIQLLQDKVREGPGKGKPVPTITPSGIKKLIPGTPAHTTMLQMKHDPGFKRQALTRAMHGLLMRSMTGRGRDELAGLPPQVLTELDQYSAAHVTQIGKLWAQATRFQTELQKQLPDALTFEASSLTAAVARQKAEQQTKTPEVKK